MASGWELFDSSSSSDDDDVDVQQAVHATSAGCAYSAAGTGSAVSCLSVLAQLELDGQHHLAQVLSDLFLILQRLIFISLDSKRQFECEICRLCC